MTDIIYTIKEFAGYQIKQRDDGYLNATEMCKVGKKKYNDYDRLNQTKEYLEALNRSTGIPADLLIEKIITGPNDNRGTWVHPRVAIHLAQWVSPQFAVQVTDWVLRFMSGDLTLVSDIVKRHDEINDTKTEILLNTMSNQINEYKVQVIELNKIKDTLEKQVENLNKFICKYCNRRYSSTTGLTRHLNTNCTDKMNKEFSLTIDLDKFKSYIELLEDYKIEDFDYTFKFKNWDTDVPTLIIYNDYKYLYKINLNESRW